MLHRVPSRAGWLMADVMGTNDRWVATLVPHHPSLGRVRPGTGRTPEEALSSLSTSIGSIGGIRPARREAVRLPRTADRPMVTAAVTTLRWMLRLNGDAIENAAGAVARNNRARRRRESVAEEVRSLTGD